MASRLNDRDVKDYLIRIYFGTYNGAIGKAIARAYLDMGRTQHGFRKYAAREQVRRETREYLHSELSSLGNRSFASEVEFDLWHEAACNQLKHLYRDFDFTIGQAQKWINMAIKYLYVIESETVDHCWSYCHVPIDNILIEQLYNQGHQAPSIGGPWSRLDDYPRYLAFQNWFRENLPGAPMDNEFSIWMKSDSASD